MGSMRGERERVVRLLTRSWVEGLPALPAPTAGGKWWEGWVEGRGVVGSGEGEVGVVVVVEGVEVEEGGERERGRALSQGRQGMMRSSC